MRWIGIIALANFLILAGLLCLIPSGPIDAGSALLLSAMICAVGIPLAIIAGIPALWLARRIATGSFVPLGLLGAIVGALITALILSGGERDLMIAAGASLGFLSAILWWAFVERYPDRRARYD